VNHQGGRRGRGLITLLCAVLTALSGCGRARVPVASAPPAPPPALTVVQAQTVVQVYFEDIGAGSLDAAYALWPPAWQAAHPIADWRAGPPLPPGAVPEFTSAQSRPAGSVYVGVRAVVTDRAGRRWAEGGFTVGVVGRRAMLLAGGIRPPLPPEDLQGLAVAAGSGGQVGGADCGADHLTWSVQPDRLAGDGRVSHIAITGPDGHGVPLPALPGFSFGTFPTFCGDLLGDGHTELVLTTATTSAGAYRQASVYALGAAGVRLLGQIPSVGDAAYPRPVAEDGLVPYAIVGLRQIGAIGQAPILAPEIWAPVGDIYVRDTAAFPAALHEDIANLTAASAQWGKCAAGWRACAAPDLLRAYYDYCELGEADAGLKALLALVPHGEAAWLRAQEAGVRQVLALPE